MKKFLVMILALTLMLALVACGGNGETKDTDAGTDSVVDTTLDTVDTSADTAGEVVDDTTVMSYADYAAAAADDAVVIEAYVQATQSWYNGAIVVYAQDQDGGYFLYNIVCAEEDAAKLVPGTKIRVNGFKTEWEGMAEVAAGATFEFVEGADSFIAEPVDLTDKLGTEELKNYQSQLASFKGLTVKEISYKNDEPGDDIYLTLTKGDADYSFCVERYLTAPDTEVYTTVGTLKAGDVVDVEGFVYWYKDSQPHITAITLAE